MNGAVLEDYVKIVLIRWRRVLVTLGATVVTVMILSLVVPKHYRATASVVADLKSSGPLDQSALPGQLVANYKGTQVDIIKSDRVLKKVVQRLHLSESPDVLEDWRSSLYYDRKQFDAWASDWMRGKTTITPSRDSNVITINVSSTDPGFAANASNAFADSYIEANIELSVEPAKMSSQWLQELSQSLRTDLETAQNKLSEFQQAHGIVVTDDRLDTESVHLTELQQQLVAAQGQHADSTSRHDASMSAEELPEVVQNQLIGSLKNKIALDEARIDELAARLGTQHPEYLSMVSELAALKTREAVEVGHIVGSLATNSRVGIHREAALAGMVAAQKEHVLTLRAQHDQASVLKHDADAAQTAYDSIKLRLAQSLLQSQLSQTNVALLSRAAPPYKPSWPKLYLNLVAGALLGGLLGIANALLQERRDQRVRNEQQVAQLTRVPVLAICMSAPPAKRVTPWVRTWAWLTDG